SKSPLHLLSTHLSSVAGPHPNLHSFPTRRSSDLETSILITGIVKEDSRSKFGYELDVTDVKIVGHSEDYPITPKEHGTDFLMDRSEEHTSELQSRFDLVCRLLLEKKKTKTSHRQ